MGKMYRPSIILSAKTGEGIEELLEDLYRRANEGKVTETLRFPASDGRRFALINQHALVKDTRYEETDVIVTATFDRPTFERIKNLPGKMETV
jgi:50S ribosomal subunit-associated GTPase HflX